MDIDQRINNIKEKHLNAYNWKSSIVPFGIWVNDRKKHKQIKYGMEDAHKYFFERQMIMLHDSMEAGSDIVPVLGIKNYAVSLIPSIFGAELTAPDDDIEKIEDSGYWVHKMFDDIKEVCDLSLPALESKMLSQLLTQIEYYKENAPGWVEISVMMIGPFSTAELLRGPEIYTDMYDDPVSVHKLLELCTHTIINVIKLIRKVCGYSEKIVNGAATPFGMWFPGIRFGDDSIINLSPQMIKEFVLPYYKMISESFDCSIALHFCSNEKLMGRHIVEGLIGSDFIKCVSTQLGTIIFEEKKEIIKNKLSVEAGYGDGVEYFTKKHDGFNNWVKRIKDISRGNTGLVIYTEVPSIYEAREMLEIWN